MGSDDDDVDDEDVDVGVGEGEEDPGRGDDPAFILEAEVPANAEAGRVGLVTPGEEEEEPQLPP